MNIWLYTVFLLEDPTHPHYHLTNQPTQIQSLRNTWTAIYTAHKKPVSDHMSNQNEIRDERFRFNNWMKFEMGGK